MPAPARRSSRVLASFLLLPLFLLAALLPAAARAAGPLTVMSFNIRYDTENDGPNRWSERRQMVLDLLKERDPDLVGLQEALDSQIRDLLEGAPGYALVGVGRDDGKAGGEFSAILFRRERLRVADAGTFWFSETPAIPGSRSWGNNVTRICTWARFIDADGRAFWVYNVHLDHESQVSRERSVDLLVRRIGQRATAAEPVVLTGDFNAGEDNPAMAPLLGRTGAETGSLSVPFVDTFRVLHPDAEEVGTYNAFKPGQTRGEKIDYVLVPPGTEVLEAAIIRESRDGRYPSDHFPVIARIRF